MEKEKLWIVQVNHCDLFTDHQAEKLLEICCPQTRQRLERRQGSRLKQGLAAHMALQYALYQGMGLLPHRYSIEYTQKGKPVVKGMPSLFISKTHSGSRGAAAVGEIPLGIDLQKKILFREALAEKLCSPQERTLLENASDKDSLMTQLFCCKEAFGKMTGKGLTGCCETELLPQGEGVFICQGKSCFTWWEEDYLFCLCAEEARWEKQDISAAQLIKWLGI